MPPTPETNQDPHWFKLKSKGSREEPMATKVKRALERVGIVLQQAHVDYIASIMFGEGLDEHKCGYCGHHGAHHIWGIDAGPDGRPDIDHFNCNQCAKEKDTSLVVCYIRPGGAAARRDSY